MTLLEMVNQVQEELKLPKSGLITDSHASRIRIWVDKIQRNFMMENTVWDELKVKGYFDTEIGKAIYTVGITGGEIDTIRNLSIGTYAPLIPRSDEQFRELKRSYTDQEQPLWFRHYGRTSSGILVELLPVPDAIYQIDTEALKKPAKLTLADDEPDLDPDTIMLGAKMLELKELGRDNSKETDEFNIKLGLQDDTAGESNFGDCEAV